MAGASTFHSLWPHSTNLISHPGSRRCLGLGGWLVVLEDEAGAGEREATGQFRGTCWRGLRGEKERRDHMPKLLSNTGTPSSVKSWGLAEGGNRCFHTASGARGRMMSGDFKMTRDQWLLKLTSV